MFAVEWFLYCDRVQVQEYKYHHVIEEKKYLRKKILYLKKMFLLPASVVVRSAALTAAAPTLAAAAPARGRCSGSF